MNNGILPERSPHFAVHKYPFFIADAVRLTLPRGARLLHVAQQPMQPADLQLWAMIDKREPMVERILLVYGTGHPMPPEPGKFIGTVFFNALVFHIFDAGEMPP